MLNRSQSARFPIVIYNSIRSTSAGHNNHPRESHFCFAKILEAWHHCANSELKLVIFQKQNFIYWGTTVNSMPILRIWCISGSVYRILSGHSYLGRLLHSELETMLVTFSALIVGWIQIEHFCYDMLEASTMNPLWSLTAFWTATESTSIADQIFPDSRDG